MAVWPDRRVRGSSPWAVGFIGYEEVARLAEELPTRERSDTAPAGLLLLEPEPVAASTSAKGQPVPPSGGARWSLDAASFRDGVEKIRERIAAGDVYQVNLCRRLTVEGWQGSLEAFAEVASDGGVPDYLARIDLDGGELLCASMEMLLRRRGVELETRPIKGTRPRGRHRRRTRGWPSSSMRIPRSGPSSPWWSISSATISDGSLRSVRWRFQIQARSKPTPWSTTGWRG
jgi:hypothetical protein